MANPKLKLDIDAASIQAELDVVLNKFEKEFTSLNKLGSTLGLGDSFTSEIKIALNELKKFQSEYKNTLSNFASGKVDVSTFDKFQKQIDTKIKGLSERITSVEKVVQDFQITLNGVDGSKVENRLTSMLNEFDEFKKEIIDVTEKLELFFNMVGSKRTNALNIDTNELERINEILKNIKKNEIGGKSGLKLNLNDSLKQLDSFEQRFYELLDDLDDTKDPKTIITLQKELGETSAQLMGLINRIIELNKIDVDSLLDGSIGKLKIGDIYDFSEFVTEVDSVAAKTTKALKVVKEQVSSAKENLKNDVKNITTTSFEFSDGGIKIPVILDKNTIEQLRPSLDSIIEALSKYAKNNPVNVSMRLFTLKGSRAEQREINKELTNIQANIAKLPEGELKESFNGLYGNLESQFRRALKLEVEVELSDKAKNISKVVNDIKNTVGQEKIPIYPEIVISQDEEEKLKQRLKEIQDGFSFNLTSEITQMTNSLKDLISQDGAEKWGKSFLENLNNIESKLKEIQPLITSLTGTTNNKKKIASDQDVNIIEQLSNAIKELNAVIIQEKDMSININIDTILEKMSELQSTIVLVHSGLGNLQAILSNVNNTGGLQVVVSTLDRIEKVISELNTKKIEIKSDVNVDEVIPNIQEEILHSGKKIQLPISVLASSIDDFINEIQFIIDSKLTNGDIGNEPFVPTDDEDLGNKQITSLNRRINNLKDKIDSTWENWHNFAMAAQNGTKFATDGIDDVIGKFGELDFWIDSISKKFSNINFTEQVNELKEISNVVKTVSIQNTGNASNTSPTASSTNTSKTKKTEELREYLNVLKQYHKALLDFEKADRVGNVGQKEDAENRINIYGQQLNDLEKYNQELSKSKEVIQANADAEIKLATERSKRIDSQAKAVKKQSDDEKRLATLREEWARKMTQWLQKNSAANKQYGDGIRSLVNQLVNGGEMTEDEIKSVISQFRTMQTEAYKTGQSGSSMFNMIKQRAKSLIATLTTFNSFYDVVRLIRQGFNSIRELDTALVDLRKTTTMSNSELEKFYFDANDVAKQLGVTTAEVIQQSAAWSRLGYSSKEAATEMARISSQFASISPGASIENSTDYLVSTMQAFNIEVEDVQRRILDNVNAIGNSMATSNAEIGEMLTRSSAAMRAANNSLEETIALESAAVEITRNAETTGTAFRTRLSICTVMCIGNIFNCR